MNTHVEYLLESEEAEKFIDTNVDTLNTGIQIMDNFRKVLKNYVFENYTNFIGKDLKDTSKNVMVFSETATAQFANELSALLGPVCYQEMTENSRSIDQYL